IRRAVILLQEKIEAILESNARVYMKSRTVQKISYSQLNEQAKDPMVIKMKKKFDITNYTFIKGVDMNEPKVDGMCVAEYLVATYKKKIPTLTIEKILSLTSNEHELDYGTTETSGLNANEIQEFCDHYKI